MKTSGGSGLLRVMDRVLRRLLLRDLEDGIRGRIHQGRGRITQVEVLCQEVRRLSVDMRLLSLLGRMMPTHKER